MCTMGMQFLRDIVAAGAAAQHHHVAAFPLLGVFEVARVNFRAGKFSEPRYV
jgi:hypothetical protein